MSGSHISTDDGDSASIDITHSKKLNKFSFGWLMASILRIGSSPKDGDDIRLQKSLLLAGAVMFVFAGILWGLMYLSLGEPAAGSIPLIYSAISFLSILIFGVTRRYHFFRFTQLLLILLLPFILMVSLGGFINSSAVILWSLVCPLGALLFDDIKRGSRWFLLFLALLLVSGLIQPYLPVARPLAEPTRTLFFIMNIGGVSIGVFVLLFYFVGQKNLFQERADNLLLNILPKEIADILKTENRTVAEYYAGASILFADVVNFTPLSAQLSPIELVELLNEVFTYFDSLVEKYGLEKIKTIGDCYMAAAGVPRPRSDHAHVLARMALDIRDYMARSEFSGLRLNLRIGINSGPVVAGVIGRKKFVYDLWGDAVNTASRMESHGLGGTVQITRATYELINDQFICEPKGKVHVKGKGEMEVWYIIGERKSITPIRKM